MQETPATTKAVSFEIASQDVNRWLDFKKISPKKREEKQDSIDSLVEAVQEGILRIDDDCNIIQKLSFPIGEELKINELKFKPRITQGDLMSYTNNVKATDADGRINAYIAALSGQPKEAVKKMDTEDYKISQSIAFFFL